MPQLSKLQEPLYAALRVLSGVFFMCHGLQKLFGLFGDKVPFSQHQMWIGGVIELTCGVAIAAGLFTRIAAFLASGTMAVAYFQFHMKMNFSHASNWLPIVNDGELAAVYCWLFLFFAVRGPGPFSLDRSFKLDG